MCGASMRITVNEKQKINPAAEIFNDCKEILKDE